MPLKFQELKKKKHDPASRKHLQYVLCSALAKKSSSHKKQLYVSITGQYQTEGKGLRLRWAKWRKTRKKEDRWICKNWKEGEHSYRRTRLWARWLKVYVMPN